MSFFPVSEFFTTTIPVIPAFLSSPEIVKNEPYGEKADVWAIGCILYQMCTLKPPFYFNNMLSLAKKIVEGDYEDIDDPNYSDKVSAPLCGRMCVCRFALCFLSYPQGSALCISKSKLYVHCIDFVGCFVIMRDCRLPALLCGQTQAVVWMKKKTPV